MAGRVLFTPDEVIATCDASVPLAEILGAIDELQRFSLTSPPAEITAKVEEIFAAYPGVSSFSIAFDKAAGAGKSGTSFHRIEFTSSTGARGSCIFKIQGEALSGGIPPLTVTDAMEMSKFRGKYGPVEARQAGTQVKKPMLQFTAYTERLAEGAEPSPDAPTSRLVHAVAWMCLAYLLEVCKRVARGGRLAAWSQAWAKENKARAAEALTAADLAAAAGAAFAGESAPPAALTAGCALQGKVAINRHLGPFVLRSAADKIASSIQTSVRKGDAAGEPLKNPILRVSLDMTGAENMRTTILDKAVPVLVVGKDGKRNVRAYAPALVTRPEPGSRPVPVSDENVHLLFRAGAVVEGIIDASSLCFSSQGVSTPIKAKLVTVTRAPPRASIADSFYADNVVTDEEAAAIIAASAHSAAPAAAAEAAPASAGAEPALEDEDDAVINLGLVDE